jgi:hypothetical protein
MQLQFLYSTCKGPKKGSKGFDLQLYYQVFKIWWLTHRLVYTIEKESLKSILEDPLKTYIRVAGSFIITKRHI